MKLAKPAVQWPFLDLNAFFVSCEQQEAPPLRGKPDAFSRSLSWNTPASMRGCASGALDHLGIDHIRVSRRISLDRLWNFTAAEALAAP
jgi:hypothetical protein